MSIVPLQVSKVLGSSFRVGAMWGLSLPSADMVGGVGGMLVCVSAAPRATTRSHSFRLWHTIHIPEEQHPHTQHSMAICSYTTGSHYSQLIPKAI